MTQRERADWSSEERATAAVPRAGDDRDDRVDELMARAEASAREADRIVDDVLSGDSLSFLMSSTQEPGQ